jgi:hypothetical protein
MNKKYEGKKRIKKKEWVKKIQKAAKFLITALEHVC